MLGLAKRVGARFLLTSTSEVYGDPLQHPQVETYWGNVNPIGASQISSLSLYLRFVSVLFFLLNLRRTESEIRKSVCGRFGYSY